ncbi:class I SAM-dependent methyltransferase [Paenibacillus sp. BSR1-1]|uniref:class I SAM-dependent methyltransferase n=1 Tax=Paenibacillus sp. BSR1-1 TaxID=3020845 RepID=UPI0025AF3980|nr:class I SAM-dependent methyltransferase [Paenibacillus sp. BSR1-1]MDN3016791.1 class I SAM-dependent methyltransferase [Paenibacillus sp. BSR1-1]
MFVTTSGRTTQQLNEKAMDIAATLEVPYRPRNKKSVQLLQEKWDSDCLVVGKERLELFQKEEHEPFFFHPNSAMFRIKRLMRGEHDPFAEAAKLSKGMTVLDCTLGLASDSIVASFLVGKEGSVTGIEGQKYMAYIVKEGLKTWDTGIPQMNEAMERITVIQAASLDYLKGLSDDSVDCVYFDPMFEESIIGSVGIKALAHFAIYNGLDEETMEEALRVAKFRVILKDHYRSSRFERYGFQVFHRQNAKFHFGYIEK